MVLDMITTRYKEEDDDHNNLLNAHGCHSPEVVSGRLRSEKCQIMIACVTIGDCHQYDK